MKPKAIVKIAVDIVMTAALIILMGYQLWGEEAHEIIGAGIFVLFIAHHILNLSWYKSLFKGKYTPARIFGIIINLLVLAAMGIMAYSGIVMSKHVFGFLPIESGMAMARRLHILGSHWGFLLMSMHIGIHWAMILGMTRKAFKISQKSKLRTAICFAAGLITAGYGVFVFVKRDFITYMLLKTEFVFLDYSEPPLLFCIDYLALMGLCIFVAYYIQKLLRRLSGGKGKEQ